LTARVFLMFFSPRLANKPLEVGDEVEVIGVGRVKRTSPVLPFHVRDNPTVTAFTNWNAAANANSIVMSTEQELHDWRLFVMPNRDT
jgi:hypothetical protein